MDDCIPWHGKPQKNGYGRTSRRRDGKIVHIGAHQLAWAEANGYDAFSIPAGQVLHRCDNRICVNPDHLYLGTHADNMADKVARDRCARQAGEKNPGSKIGFGDVIEIRRRRNALGQALKTIAADYGISIQQVSRIAKGQRWIERGEHR